MEDSSGKKPAPRYGAFAGVFLPTLLTIVGAVLYLRCGWLVGYGGLLQAIGVVLAATSITLATALSFTSIVTNIELGFGGLFPIIGRSLGFEAAGSVTIPFYLAQSISVAFYIFAFAEGWARLFPDHPQSYVVLTLFAGIFGLALLDMKLVSLVRYPIALVVTGSLVSIFMGPGFKITPTVYPVGGGKSFWALFAVFFPAVTGVTTGVNLSGTLRNPRRDIPRGTLAAWGVSTLIYLAVVAWVSGLAPTSELRTHMTILVDRAFYGPAVLVGLLAATLSAALNSMVGAPQILYAIAASGLLPGQVFRKIDRGIPRPAVVLTGAIALVTIVVGLSGGGLNQIAPLMTMFFLVVYGVLNATILLEQQLGLVSFRPTLKIPKVVSALGVLGTLLAMFSIDPEFAIIAVIAVLILYDYLSRRHVETEDGDLRSGLLLRLVQWAIKKAQLMPRRQYRAWQPNLLVPYADPQVPARCQALLETIVQPQGILVFLNLAGEHAADVDSLMGPFRAKGIFCKLQQARDQDPMALLQISLQLNNSSLLRPNTLFYLVDSEAPLSPQAVLEEAIRDRFGVIFVLPSQRPNYEAPKQIHVWIREQSPEWKVSLRLSNLDLALLIAFQMARNSGAQLHLFTVVAEVEETEAARVFLHSLVEQGRLPADTQTHAFAGTFSEAYREAPPTDFNIFGLSRTWNSAPMDSEPKFAEATNLFVHDSGFESAMA